MKKLLFGVFAIIMMVFAPLSFASSVINYEGGDQVFKSDLSKPFVFQRVFIPDIAKQSKQDSSQPSTYNEINENLATVTYKLNSHEVANGFYSNGKTINIG
jgi:flagellar motor protein MotB